jgi:hypothetical protein
MTHRLVFRGSLVSTLFAFGIGGCSRPEERASAPPPAQTAASGSVSAAAASSAPRPPSRTSEASYAGTYSIAPGSVYIPTSKEFSGARVAKDEPSKLVGEGALTFTIDAQGRLRGTVDSGPLSPAILDGSTLEGDTIRGTIRRRNPSDEGLTGTLVGTRAGTKLEATLFVADAMAVMVRTGKVTALVGQAPHRP